ncbi:uncharacterized protein LOC125662519 isoform X1 [Ostrea edulis]|uniref:uncharacterized protein LOC125662519 isoform X1 n=1 Tax=Ostrea edulis TaxID=37623 RepID=UPI0020965DF1|nr:uncharacterized protein LOC125662519 isoform X1 [Ostrea edulis]
MTNTVIVVRTVVLMLAASELCWTRFIALNEDTNGLRPQTEVLSGFDEDFEDPLVVVDSYPDQVRSIPIRDLSMIGDNPSQFQNKHRGMRISFKDGVLSGPVSKRDPLTCFFNIVACYG